MTSPSVLSENHHRALLANPEFAALSDVVRNDVLIHGRQRRLAAGQTLFRRGDKPDGLYIVLEGSLRVSGTSRDGLEAVLNFYEPGCWIGAVSALDGLPRAHDAQAVTASLVLQITPADLETLIARHPPFCRFLLHLQSSQMRALLVGFEAFSTQSLEQRFASRLMALASAFGSPMPQGGLNIELRLSQETLAQLLGTTRQRINQLLKKWEQEGLIEQRYGRIVVLDQDRLEELAQE
ncbi:Crp/Fnr family transcriptional regulator [Zestomonas carbonaria]|uniref:CRP-like cAMP-activated global transcriptional regulator n=1 Tax=Zestomonas carbonaria TaxID=2762745 RepID=A0A7U7EPU3_9GAMM|nr:Crp/Fnr family transcriptional regulator [Pseudomonas carbonaria]CAD5108427.1 CRP-like cAMP-activated global transcriptional regulator [Pseudomonas carbonaria]